MSDINMLFDLRVMQMEDGSWTVALIPPDDDDSYGWRHYPQPLIGADFAHDSFVGDDLILVMADATAAIDMALNPAVSGDAA